MSLAHQLACAAMAVYPPSLAPTPPSLPSIRWISITKFLEQMGPGKMAEPEW